MSSNPTQSLPSASIPSSALPAAPGSCCGPNCCSPATQSPATLGTKPAVTRSLPLAEASPQAAFTAAATEATDPADAVRQSVRAGYAQIARSGGWSAAGPNALPATAPLATATSGCCSPSASPGGGCCGPATFSPEQLALAIGYDAGELADVPSANLGLSCGNPTAIASLQPGEVVLDLGSGAGFDCFVAGRKVGPTGRVIGVDMTADMLSKARQNLKTYTAQTGLSNVEFRLGEIEHLPIADASVDVILSNCVLNLSPEKAQVWLEVARVLRPGGRVAISDLALLRPLPEAIRADLESLIGCVAGAVLIEETRQQLIAAGLIDIQLRTKPEYIQAMTNWQDPLYQRIIAALPPGTSPGEYITSVDISARKAGTK